jgi:hypothetical protein
MALGVIAALVVLVAFALYAFVIGVFTKGTATWAVAVLRPLLLTLVITPGILVGHGIGVAPMAMVLGYELLHPRLGSALSWNLSIWLISAFVAFLFECALGAWRRRRPRRT